MMTPKSAQDVVAFWFEELEPKDWWAGGEAVDAAVSRRFGQMSAQALAGELHPWRVTSKGRLAEILCLDQFPRNLHRGTARAFAGDPIALVLCQEAILGGFDQALPLRQRAFLYMPLMHAESLAMHAWAAELYSVPGLEDNFKALEDHTQVLKRFGRYPSRNAALARSSTPEEQAYLKDGKSWGQ